MVNKLFLKSKKIFTEPQSSILSAATIIMLMIIASRILGLVRQRTLAHFFGPDEISLFFAAFRLPDTIFEILVFGTFSSAFIPVFAKVVEKDKESAWKLASVISNIGLIIFIILALIVSFFADHLYNLIAPGYSSAGREQIVQLTKILFAAQGFFVISYVLTGVLESLRRFLVPALAPIFYNLGIIFGTIFLSSKFFLLAPAIGVFIGALLHFLIQLPLAIKLGYKVTTSFSIDNNVKKIGRLAFPRVLELSVSQIVKSVELYLSSLISTAAYAYFYLGNTIQLLPVGIFGTAIAKAALPTLARDSDDLEKFQKHLWNSFYQIIFLVLPVSTVLIVLRIPIVRLIYGTEIFDWTSTVQTGMVVSAFALGVVFQAVAALLARAFYALHNTKTPVTISIISMITMIFLNFVFIRGLNFPVWGIALAFSLGSAIQAIMLFFLLKRKLDAQPLTKLSVPIIKALLASSISGIVMFVMLKLFDRSVWVKRLSFLGLIEGTENIRFEKFVLDTRFTINLLVLTLIVSFIGMVVYLGLSILLRSNEVWTFFNLIKRILIKHKVSPIPEEQEPVVPTPTDTVQ
ncbi:murein biosynthesis integral membrane protein MurJ [Candidatus Woesebacteria bacterium RBG_16_34_12]|uniref:Probable lipid II flippase MurJ n=1 Tax=Candidatus Woesebacteria bacterium RBG_16_34_12 TaxID=1802480 RepID=A0A1F7XBF2_9BACT|nr:MAG: murein biosynthesis integral membrane protein MurJ [Candidatus Woesebacteria bacterium RBG_16_34_12]